MDEVVSISDAFLTIENGLIKDFGPSETCPEASQADEVTDAEGGMVMPMFCDSHTHICFAGSREQEFIDKINGLSYEEIAARGGGILNSADLLHDTSEDDLYYQTMERVREMIGKGTGAIEIKSGYGLNTQDELKMLRVIKRVKETSPAITKSTFLGAHAVGRTYTGRQEEYVDLVCSEMIPAVASEGLADYVDVFCDEGPRPTGFLKLENVSVWFRRSTPTSWHAPEESKWESPARLFQLTTLRGLQKPKSKLSKGPGPCPQCYLARLFSLGCPTGKPRLSFKPV